MTDILPFRLGIDHTNKYLRMTVVGKDGKEVSANMDLEQIAEFMTILSHCQHALVLSKSGKEINLPIDPNVAFTPEAGTWLLGAYEGVAKVTVGTDEVSGTVALQVLSPSGRLSGFRIGVETAQSLGSGLLDSAKKISIPTTKQ